MRCVAFPAAADLVTAAGRLQAAEVLCRLVTDLGGQVVGEGEEGVDAVGIDLSLGSGCGLFPAAPRDSLLLNRIEDGLRMILPIAQLAATKETLRPAA